MRSTGFAVARTQRPPCYPARLVATHSSWAEPDLAYDASVPEFTAEVVLRNADTLATGGKWADAPDASPSRLRKRKTFASGCEACLDESGVPYDAARERYLFPGGRTGVRGRGLLGRYGPNHAADPLVTRHSPATGELEVVVVMRRDSDSVALPGGMVEPGDTVAGTLYGEFTEEAARPNGAAERLFRDARYNRGVVYRGPVDDPRTTDEAWIETTAVHFHATADIAAELVLEVSDQQEIRKVMWKPVAEIGVMYASHKDWLDAVAEKMSTEPTEGGDARASKARATHGGRQGAKGAAAAAADTASTGTPEDTS